MYARSGPTDVDEDLDQKPGIVPRTCNDGSTIGRADDDEMSKTTWRRIALPCIELVVVTSPEERDVAGRIVCVSPELTRDEAAGQDGPQLAARAIERGALAAVYRPRLRATGVEPTPDERPALALASIASWIERAAPDHDTAAAALERVRDQLAGAGVLIAALDD